MAKNSVPPSTATPPAQPPLPPNVAQTENGVLPKTIMPPQGVGGFLEVTTDVNGNELLAQGTSKFQAASNTAMVSNLALIAGYDPTADIVLRSVNGVLRWVVATNPAPPANNPPSASSVTLSGTPQVGSVLTTQYTYSDAENDPQSGTVFQWYRADNNTGTNRAPISGAAQQGYTLVSADLGKFIQCGVTPHASTGALVGSEALSAYTAAITNPVAPSEVAAPFTIGLEFVTITGGNTLQFSNASGNYGYGRVASTHNWAGNQTGYAAMDITTAGAGFLGVSPVSGTSNRGETDLYQMSHDSNGNKFGMLFNNDNTGVVSGITPSATTRGRLVIGATQLWLEYTLDGTSWTQVPNSVKPRPVDANGVVKTLYLKYFSDYAPNITHNVVTSGGNAS